MSKTVKWILISLVILIVALVGLKAAGVFGKDEGKDELTGMIGNIIAEYPKNSEGIALAEEIDQTGKKWWFVLMYNNITPLNTVLYHGNNNESPYFSYGWMSHNFLEIIK